MRSGLLLLILTLSLLFSCGGPHTMAIDNKWSDEEADLIISCMEEWIEATDSDEAAIFIVNGFNSPEYLTTESFEKDRNYSVLFFVTTEDPVIKDLYKKRDSQFLGIYDQSSENILIVFDRVQSERELKEVILHEMGHLLGLDHHDGVGVMKQGAGGDNICISEDDLDAFCDKHHCGPNAHSTCL